MAPLTAEERTLWFGWKRAHEVVRTNVVEEVTAATGLSDPDIAVLLRLDDAGGTLRQNHLAALLGWDRARLSHHVTRMEDRALLTRRRSGGGVEVGISTDGREAIDTARPIHAAAVRRHLIEPLTAAQLHTLHTLLADLSGEPASHRSDIGRS